jgi:hypothetical protein
MGKDKKKNKSAIVVGVEELSPAEIKRRESDYWQDVRDFSRGLMQGERFKKDMIIRLAKDLEKARTIDHHKISIRLKGDLQDLIERKLLDKNYIPMVLVDYAKSLARDSNYFVKPQASRFQPEPEGTKIDSYQPSVTEDEGEDEDETDEEKAERKKRKEEKEEELELQRKAEEERALLEKEQQRMNSLAQTLLGSIMGTVGEITGLSQTGLSRFGRDYNALNSATKDYRFKLTKAFSDFDLQVAYGFSRTLSVVLNSFLQQLDDELDIRKSKKSLTSE